MSTTTDEPLTGVRKAAILCMALGTEAASRILQQLSPAAVRLHLAAPPGADGGVNAVGVAQQLILVPAGFGVVELEEGVLGGEAGGCCQPENNEGDYFSFNHIFVFAYTIPAHSWINLSIMMTFLTDGLKL